MGLVLLDNPPLEELTAALGEVGRNEFLMVCAPLPRRDRLASEPSRDPVTANIRSQ